MILDALLTFTGGTALPNGGPSLAQAITATSDSTNILDLALGQTNTGGGLPLSATSPSTQPFRDLGIGDDPAIKILVQCLTTFATGTSLTTALQGAPDSGTGGTGAFATYYSTAAVATANLIAGARLMDMDLPRPPATLPEPRFLKLVFTVGGSNFTNASIYAGLVLDRFDQVYNATVNSVSGGYAPGVTVAN
jgi:hypothetical protein